MILRRSASHKLTASLRLPLAKVSNCFTIVLVIIHMPALPSTDIARHTLSNLRIKSWLLNQFYIRHNKTPSAQALADARGQIEARATFEGPANEVFTRIAQRDNAVYIDLADKEWRVVKVTAEGWRVHFNPRVRFRRPRGMGTLPVPERGGSINNLKQFLNLSHENDWYVLVCWLLGAFHPTGPYPVLVLNGEQGSAKSTTAGMLRALTDPNQCPLRALPRDERDLAIAANNAWVVAIDNVSYIPDWLSDALSRLSTGGGFATRELYADDEEKLFHASRPTLLNGIDSVVTRGDLLDRSYNISLPVIHADKRRQSQDLWIGFENSRAQIFGALMTAISGALANKGSVHLDELPRMADHAVWCTAAETSLGWAKDECD